MNIGEILQILPHRFPFLLVDRIVEFDPPHRCLAYKNVTFNEPFFQGHFPETPIMPGVLTLEALAQTGAILAMKSDGLTIENNVIFLAGIEHARFKRPVIPGDRLDLDVSQVKRRQGKLWRIKGIASVDGDTVAETEFLATIKSRNDLKSPESRG